MIKIVLVHSLFLALPIWYVFDYANTGCITVRGWKRCEYDGLLVISILFIIIFYSAYLFIKAQRKKDFKSKGS